MACGHKTAGLSLYLKIVLGLMQKVAEVVLIFLE